jgi:predicted DNA-binding transcriptional regulator AlpA
MSSKFDDDELVTPKEAAKITKMSVSWLAKARQRGDGPKYVRFGNSIRYLKSKLLEPK